MLFSREFLEAARDHLTPGGVYAQWFHTYETDSETVALVLRTYAVGLRARGGLVHGGNRPAADRAARPRGGDRSRTPGTSVRATRLRGGLRRAPGSPRSRRCSPTSSCRVGVLARDAAPGRAPHAAAPAPRQPGGAGLLRRDFGALPPTAEARAGRGRQAQFPVDALHDRASAARLPETERLGIVEQICRHRAAQCATQLAAWIVDAPSSPLRDNRAQPHRPQSNARAQRAPGNGRPVGSAVRRRAGRAAREGDARGRRCGRPSCSPSSTTTARRSRARRSRSCGGAARRIPSSRRPASPAAHDCRADPRATSAYERAAADERSRVGSAGPRCAPGCW